MNGEKRWETGRHRGGARGRVRERKEGKRAWRGRLEVEDMVANEGGGRRGRESESERASAR